MKKMFWLIIVLLIAGTYFPFVQVGDWMSDRVKPNSARSGVVHLRNISDIESIELVPLSNNPKKIALRDVVVKREGDLAQINLNLVNLGGDQDYPYIRVVYANNAHVNYRNVEIAPSEYSHGSKLGGAEAISLHSKLLPEDAGLSVEPFYPTKGR